MDEPSEQLLVRYQAGDETAAEEMFRRYVNRLTVFARARLAPRVARRVDPEDIVLSAYRSFFVRARNGQFSLQRGGDLWRLLVGITLNRWHVNPRKNARSSVKQMLLFRLANSLVRLAPKMRLPWPMSLNGLWPGYLRLIAESWSFACSITVFRT